MIEVNLLPGAKRKKKSSAPTLDIRALVGGLSERVKDKFLAGAVVSAFVGLGAVGFMYVTQARAESQLKTTEERLMSDSARMIVVIRDRIRAEAKRDTVTRQLNVVSTLDGDRFIWPHILDEISRALPPFTWLSQVTFTGTPQGSRNVVAASPPAAAGRGRAGGRGRAAGPAAAQVPFTQIPKDEVRIQVQGRTVDFQAATLFWKQLEASPFLTNVSFDRSEQLVEGGKGVLSFQLTMTFVRADSSHVRLVPLRME